MSKTILIVDDSLSLRQLVSMTLKRAGYEVVEACDGKDALAKLGAAKFDLIISDVNMPNMDGLTFLKEIKLIKEHRFTPVIMLTTESAEEKMREGQQSGAKAWMVKPFKPEQMLAAVTKLTMG
jgi:two-component system chemotaxis response regulator CheY